MEKLILSILMLKRATSYEIRNIIRQYYKDMCSDSLGAIQATLKKLLEKGFVTCNEFVEKGVNKKIYSITVTGRASLMEWLKTPMDMSKGKNMELGKLLLMGLVPYCDRTALIDEAIMRMNTELTYLEAIQKHIVNFGEQERSQFASFYLEQDMEYSLGIQNATNNPNIIDNVNTIGKFQALTLQYGIDNMKFQIEWFSKLKSNIIKEGLANG